MKDFLRRLDSSIAVFKTRQEEERKKKREEEEEVYQLLSALIGRANSEDVVISLGGPSGSVVVSSDVVMVGNKDSYTPLETPWEKGYIDKREKAFLILRLALEGQVEIEIKGYRY